jgi:hypothetical protein
VPDPSPSPSPAAWPEQDVGLSAPDIVTASATSLAVAGGAVYGLLSPNATQSVRSATPFRYPAAGGAPITGAPIPGAADLAAAGGWIWVVSDPATSTAVSLYRLNPTSLAVISEERLPVARSLLPDGQYVEQNPDLASTQGSTWLWVAAGQDLFRVQATTGAFMGPIPEGQQIQSVSLDPSGSLLYSGGEGTSGGAIITEYRASTGALLQTAALPVAIAGAEVAGTDAGVWTSFRSGMAGQAELLAQSTLRYAAPPQQITSQGAVTTFNEMGGVGISVSQGVLWLTSASTLTCADPTTSDVRATETVASPYGVVASNHTLYGGGAGVLSVITPPAACFG